MARHSHARSIDGSFIFLGMMGVTIWAHPTWIAYALYGLLVAAGLVGALKPYRWLRFRRQSKTFADIDTMDGLSFERYVADLLKQHGFRNVSLTEQYDMGIDIVADKDGQRWGIQVKRYSGLVKAAAVRQVVTALKFYGCERSMVATNSTYSNAARQLADSNDCVLIDRPKLLRLIG